jgi:hypothetical protein
MGNIKIHNVDDDDSNTALPPWVAYEDEKEKSKENKPSYSDEEISEGEALLSKVQGAFPTCRAYLNARQKFLAVKVGPITVRERITPQYKEMISIGERENIEVVMLGKNLIFRIKKEEIV